MEDDAIREDVETAEEQTVEEVEQEEVEAPLTGREAIMAQALAKRRDELEEDGFELDPVEQEEPEEVVEDEPEEDVPEPEKEDETVTVKVDGEERGVTEQEIREYQKNQAADKRLEEANLKARELAERENALKLKEEQLKNAKPQKTKAVIDKDIAGKLSEAILTEDTDTVADILGQVAGREQVPVDQISTEDVNKAVANAIQKDRFDNEVTRARTKFAKNHKDLADNPMLVQMVNNRVGEIWQTPGKKDPWAVFDQAANEVREGIGKTFGKDQKSLRAEQHEKRKTAQPPRRATSRSNINTEAPPPKTRKQTVAEMVESRNARLS